MKSNRELDSSEVAAAEDALFEAILTLKSVGEAREFFNDLCTPAELQALTDRWTVVEPLVEGTPYREIAANTGVSVTTVGRVARFLTQGNGGYQRVYARLKRARLKRKTGKKSKTS